MRSFFTSRGVCRSEREMIKGRWCRKTCAHTQKVLNCAHTPVINNTTSRAVPASHHSVQVRMDRNYRCMPCTYNIPNLWSATCAQRFYDGILRQSSAETAVVTYGAYTWRVQVGTIHCVSRRAQRSNTIYEMYTLFCQYYTWWWPLFRVDHTKVTPLYTRYVRPTRRAARPLIAIPFRLYVFMTTWQCKQ